MLIASYFDLHFCVVDAEKIARKKSTAVNGVTVRFSLVPLSSLKEDYSCSVLVFQSGLPGYGQEAVFDALIGAAEQVVLSRDKGDYDIFIINAQMALIFVDDRKKGIFYTDRMCSHGFLAFTSGCCCYGTHKLPPHSSL